MSKNVLLYGAEHREGLGSTKGTPPRGIIHVIEVTTKVGVVGDHGEGDIHQPIGGTGSNLQVLILQRFL